MLRIFLMCSTQVEKSLNSNMMFVDKLLNLRTSVADLKDHWVTVDKDLIFVPEERIYSKWNRSRTIKTSTHLVSD